MMELGVVHRIVEQHAALRGDVIAVAQSTDVLTYRALNHRANSVARYLLEHGFHRGGHLIVALPAGSDLATVLLATLKSGGSYTWRAGEAESSTVRIGTVGDDPAMYTSVDLTPALQAPVHHGPNLPVLIRPTDIACVLGSHGRSVLVPHSTLASLPHVVSTSVEWMGEPSTFDLWAGLLTAATLTVDGATLQRAA